MNAVILIVQICLAPAAGGQLLQGCAARTVEADTCAIALSLVEAGLNSDRVAVATGCVAVLEPRVAAPQAVRQRR